MITLRVEFCSQEVLEQVEELADMGEFSAEYIIMKEE